jgi:TolC family type I secretion outer membrane protein
MARHDRILASRAQVDAAMNRAREAWQAWYPTLDSTANYGREWQIETGEDTNTIHNFHEFDLKFTQLLWDFGASNAGIEIARLQLARAERALMQIRQNLLLEAAVAYLNVRRASTILDLAIQSETNIRKQTGLEEARVEQGAGLSTDVLQAKTQLAGAQARLAIAEGALATSLNRYRAVFDAEPINPANLDMLMVEHIQLPKSQPETVSFALEQNPEMLLVRLDSIISRETTRQTKSTEFFPSLKASGESNWKQDVAGVTGFKREALYKVELTFPFNLGFTAVNTLRASQSDQIAAERTVLDTKRRVEEAARNAWQQLHTATQTAKHLQNQATIAAAFLELARQERTLGQRSLIDVLTGETALINAQSDAASSQTDVIIAKINMMNVTGQLEVGIFQPATKKKKP